MPDRKAKPNPGSDTARAAGCMCPVMDNNHGRESVNIRLRGGWIYVEGCPVHTYSFDEEPD